MKEVVFNTIGTCSKCIILRADDNKIITDLQVLGGCNGNLQGIASLVKGMHLSEVQERLGGIRCKDKPTSCPDQISQAAAKLAEQY